MSNIDASLYIIECMYNVNKDMVTSNIIPLIKTIRKNPVAKNTPIIFIEQCIIDIGSIHNEFINSVIEKNDELNKQVDKAINKGEKDLYSSLFRKHYEKSYDIISVGHRNPIGVVQDPYSGTIIATEHGPRGGDESELSSLIVSTSSI